MVTQDGWELYDLVPRGTTYSGQDAENRRNAEADAARRAKLPEWQAELPRAEAALVEKAAAVDAVRARLGDAQAAYERRYKVVTGGRALRDPRTGGRIIWADDERCQPELGRRRLVEEELKQANAEVGEARRYRDGVNAEICWIKTTVPWTA